MQVDLWDEIVEKLNAGDHPKLAGFIGKRLAQIKGIQSEASGLLKMQASLQQQESDVKNDMDRNVRLLDELRDHCEHWVRDEDGWCIACQERR